MIDLIYAILIIVIFITMFGYSVMIAGTKNVKDNWAEYKCNPVYMPFSNNIVGVSAQKNMTECIQSMQSNYMDFILQPIQYLLNVVGVLIGAIIDTISDLQDFTSDFTNSQNSMFGDLFSSLGGILGGSTDLFGKISDMMGKTMAITTVIQYISEGMVLMAESLVSAVTGGCFHPNTMLKLQNGSDVAIKDINLGDILSNGSVVEATMLIKNVDETGKIKEHFYTIYDKKLDTDIYVTGSHLVFDPFTNCFVNVKNATQSRETEEYSETLCCLITSDHRIVIGEEVFWDWEDDGVL